MLSVSVVVFIKKIGGIIYGTLFVFQVLVKNTGRAKKDSIKKLQ
jgi:hypothetical protein